MYTDYMKLFNPMPKFDLQWYKGEDQYSEGNVEDVVLKLIAENAPGNYSKAIKENFCWSTFYHLTHIRENILNWYPFAPDSDILEVGCGMGAITSMLCDRCKSVTAVELSKRRATGTLLRCRDKDNLRIIVGNLNDIKFEKKFDYITLIGVFEYQGNYTDSDNPYHDFLCKIKNLLKPNGKLLIAIENQYGLKYWCGAREDHTAIPFDGINQYDFSDKKVRTFSKVTLEKIAKECGFYNTYFYYPMPDYKLPTVVYSQDSLPSNCNMFNVQYYYIPNNSTLLVQEDKVYQDIIENGVFEFFANSFLLECSETGDVGSVKFASMSNQRLPEYQIVTRFTRENQVEKYALRLPQGEKHITETVDNQDDLKQAGLKVWQYKNRNGKIISPQCDAKTAEEILIDKCKKKDKEGFMSLLDKLYEQILNSSEIVNWQENILYTDSSSIVPNKDTYGPILKKGYVDMILRNAFWIEEDFWWYDQEWCIENIPAKFILYRALQQSYSSFPEMEQFVPMVELATRYDLINIWKNMELLEGLFESSVIDEDYYCTRRQLKSCDINICVKNINNLI